MAETPTSIQVRLPLFALPQSSEMSRETLEDLGLVHLGDAVVDVPITFSAQGDLPPSDAEPLAGPTYQDGCIGEHSPSINSSCFHRGCVNRD